MRHSKCIKYSALLLILLLLTQCIATNWRENYKEKEKSPFGTYILFNESNALFNNNGIEFLKENALDYLTENYQEKQANFANYVCIKFEANKLTRLGIKDLLTFVHDGNDAFISLNYFSQDLQDLLDFTTENLDEDVYSPQNLKKLDGNLNLKNEEYEKQNFYYDRNLRGNYFTSYNKDKSIVLGTQKIGVNNEPVFIKVYHGKGAIYLHTQPIVFTNYYLLKGDNYKYAENVLSYLPDRKILWDPQLKYAKFQRQRESTDRESVFKFFLQNPSLKWSLYVFFFGLLLFIIFNARRKQRVIPIIPELENSTVAFTHTIANLYLNENDHKSIVDKKIVFFLERIRRNYLIETTNLNKDFIQRLASKSGNSVEITNYIIKTIIALNKKAECTQDELYSVNVLIENFFNPTINERNN